MRAVQPLVHVFGHIHTGHGVSTGTYAVAGGEGERAGSHATTLFVNAAVCDEDYQPIQKPVLVRFVHAGVPHIES